MASGRIRKMWALSGAQLSAPRSLLVQGGDTTMVKLPCPSFLMEHVKEKRSPASAMIFEWCAVADSNRGPAD